MPLLTYECSECKNKFEELISEHNKNDIKCPDCQSKNVKRSYFGKSYMGVTKISQSKESCSTCSGGGCPFS